MFDDSEMAHDEFAARIEKLITDVRQRGLSDEAIAAGLEEAAKALREGVSWGVS